MLLAAVVLKAQCRTLVRYELSMLFSTSVINVPVQCIVNSNAQARSPQKLLCPVWVNWKVFHSAAEYAGRLHQFRAHSVPEDGYVQGGQILSNPWLRSYYNCYFWKMRRIICMSRIQPSDNYRLPSGCMKYSSWGTEKVFVFLQQEDILSTHKYKARPIL